MRRSAGSSTVRQRSHLVAHRPPQLPRLLVEQLQPHVLVTDTPKHDIIDALLQPMYLVRRSHPPQAQIPLHHELLVVGVVKSDQGRIVQDDRALKRIAWSEQALRSDSKSPDKADRFQQVAPSPQAVRAGKVRGTR